MIKDFYLKFNLQYYLFILYFFVCKKTPYISIVITLHYTKWSGIMN